MISPENNFLNETSGLFETNKKPCEVPLEHLDYKYVNTCEDIKELEKIYKILVSGVEGKYPDLERHVAKKIESLNPNSRALRKDQPIISKMGIPKTERTALDEDLNEFVSKFENISKVFDKSNQIGQTGDDNEGLPPIRNNATTVRLDPKNTKSEDTTVTKTPVSGASNGKSKKSPKPRDYNDWAKIERMLDNEDEDDTEKPAKDSKANKFETKVVADKTQINCQSTQLKESLKKLPTPVVKDDIDEGLKELKADQEKCKGNESFKCGCFEEALHYYTKSIQYLPTAASFNNRAMAYLKLEKWDLAIEDCNYVLKYEVSNIKALMRRSTAYLKKKKYAQAKADIDQVLQMEESNKKALELQAEINTLIKKAGDEEAKVKAMGGKRLQIEESDTDEEDVEEKLENIILNSKSERPDSIQVKDKVSGQKTSIKISEVESEEYDDETDDEEKKVNEDPQPQVRQVIEPVVQPVVEQVKIELPQRIVEFKDKANLSYANGQYSDALEFYTFAIDALKSEKNNNLELDIYFKNTLAILYSNRASSNQKNCNFKSSLNDCDEALSLIDSLTNLTSPQDTHSLKVKLLLKKSTAYEAMEKFKEAFLECEKLMKIDHTNQNVQTAFNRLRNILKETGQFDNLRSQTNKPVKEEHVKEQPVKEDLTAIYNDLKAKGNDYVKKGEYNYAVGFYTKCIELDADNTVGYLNRSLCYVKLNQADMAIADSGFVLDREPNNVKALYRRASAYKIKKNYELVEADLKKLLNLEANNLIAAKEYKEICEILTRAEEDKKKELVRQKEMIEAKLKSLEEDMAREKKNFKEKEMAKDVEKVNETVVTKEKLASPVTFNKISNGYEFLQGWNSVNPKDIDSYGRLLMSMSPKDLPVFIGSKLDDEMLSRLIKAIHRLKNNKEQAEGFDAVQYLNCLTKTQRFNVTKLFVDKEDVKLIQEVLKRADSDPDVSESVRKAFDL